MRMTKLGSVIYAQTSHGLCNVLFLNIGGRTWSSQSVLLLSTKVKGHLYLVGLSNLLLQSKKSTQEYFTDALLSC